MAYQPTLPSDPWQNQRLPAGNPDEGSPPLGEAAFERLTAVPDARFWDFSSPNPKLQEIVQQACSETGATGAAIALMRDEVFTCCATAGSTAPDFGVRVDTDYGLSAACVHSREVQCCHDAETDHRVDADVCMNLGIRSVLIIPIEYEDCLFGIFEVFSPIAYTFTDRDIRALRSLSWQVLDALQVFPSAPEITQAPPAEPTAEIVVAEQPRAEAGPVPAPAPVEPQFQATPAEIPSPEMPAEPPTPRVHLMKVKRDPLMIALTVMVIIVALLLGWMLGRVGWHLASRPPATVSSAAPANGTVAAAAPNSKRDASVPNPAAKPSGSRPNELVVYKNGKVIFQTRSAEKLSSAESTSTDLTRDGSASRPVQIAPEVADSFIVHRVEPEYPDRARQQRIQGPVVLAARVGGDGLIQQLRVLDGDSQLALAAIDAVRRWEFKPFAPKGRAQDFETQITVNFALPNQSGAN